MFYNDLQPNFGDPSRALEDARLYLEGAEEMVRNDPANVSAQFSRAIATYGMSFYLRESDPRYAEKMAAKAVRMFDAMLAAGNRDYLVNSRRVRALLRLGEAQLKAGHIAQSRATAQSALDEENRIAPQVGDDWTDEHQILVQILTLLGEGSAAAGDYESAERYLQEAHQQALQIAQSQELQNVIPLINVERSLAAYYVRRHRAEAANACYAQIAGIWQRFPEPNQYVDLQRNGK